MHCFVRLSVVSMFLISATAGLHGQTERKIALVGGMLLDGYEESEPLHHAAILIEGNRIVKVGRASEIQSTSLRVTRSGTTIGSRV